MIYDKEVITQMIRDHFISKNKSSDDGSGIGWYSYPIEIEGVYDKWKKLEINNELCVYYNIIINSKSSHLISFNRNLYLSNLSNKISNVRNEKLNKLGI